MLEMKSFRSRMKINTVIFFLLQMSYSGKIPFSITKLVFRSCFERKWAICWTQMARLVATLTYNLKRQNITTGLKFKISSFLILFSIRIPGESRAMAKIGFNIWPAVWQEQRTLGWSQEQRTLGWSQEQRTMSWSQDQRILSWSQEQRTLVWSKEERLLSLSKEQKILGWSKEQWTLGLSQEMRILADHMNREH